MPYKTEIPSLIEDSPIFIVCKNLLNHQIFEELKECMCSNSVDLVSLCDLLNAVKKSGLPK